MKKRCLGLLLAAAMVVSLLVIPAGAETVRFSDITDQKTAVAVEVLRLLEVLDGMEDGTFRPYGTLTRSQFCKMAVHAMNKQNKLGLYSTVTVFPDVKPSHWAAGYINMAAKGEGMIAGYPDGKFHPEDPVTIGQAVTILVRLLGYKDSEIGGVWPDSHMAMAATIGLTDGLSGASDATLNRGQAATLFLNLLSAKTAADGVYMETLGTLMKSVVVSSSAGSDGKQLETASGTTYPLASGRTSSGVLNGSYGTLIVKQGKVLTFVPEGEDHTRVVTVSSCTPSQIVDTNGVKYAVSGETTTYYNGEEGKWSEAAAWLHAGASVSLSLDEDGGVIYIFVGGGNQADTAVIVSADASAVGFGSLTGGASNYSIYKNGVLAGISDLKKNDVATYSVVTNSIRVCDTRVSVYYESCSPTPAAPEEITVLGGTTLKVLPMAQSSVARFKPGQQMTLLLTEDGQVAGAVEGSNLIRSNAVGVVTDEGIQLLCGTARILLDKSKVKGIGDYEGQLVRVSASRKDIITVSRLSGSVSGDLNVSARTLGGQKLAENVMVFRGGEDISLSQLTDGIVSASEIDYVRTNWAGQVDLIGLKGQGGNVYYGKAVVETVPDPDEFDSHQTVNLLKVVYGEGLATSGYRTGYSVRNGEYIAMRISDGRVAGVSVLTKLKNVSNSAWSGRTAVTVGGKTYTVPEDVACYNMDSQSWVSLSEARAYSSQANLYVEGGTVRVLEVWY